MHHVDLRDISAWPKSPKKWQKGGWVATQKNWNCVRLCSNLVKRMVTVSVCVRHGHLGQSLRFFGAVCWFAYTLAVGDIRSDRHCRGPRLGLYPVPSCVVRESTLWDQSCWFRLRGALPPLTNTDREALRATGGLAVRTRPPKNQGQLQFNRYHIVG